MHSLISSIRLHFAMLVSSLLLEAATSGAHIDMSACSAAQSEKVSKAFTASKTYDGSSCPDSFIWKAHLYTEDGPRERIYINAGMNKGYNFGEFLSAFAPWTGMHTGRWKRAINRNSVVNINGGCNEGKHFGHQLGHLETTFRVREHPRILIVGIDLNESNIKLVRAILHRLKRNHPNDFRNVSVITLYSKVSSTDEAQVSVPLCDQGEELCGHGQTNTSASALTSSVTLDTIVSKIRKDSKGIYSRMKIDMIQIDTEGHDPDVLKGMTNILQQKLARVVTFEYQWIGEWKTTQLRDVVATFAAYNYFCFFEGLHGRLWPITGSCWNPAYEFHRWSNVACFDVADSWYHAIQRFVVREPPFTTLLSPLEAIYLI